MIEIIPAIDIIGGKCVRLTQGDYNRVKAYAADPVDMAMRFQDHGLRRLHVVDLDGAKEGHLVNYRILERIAARTGMVIDTGGGIKSDEDLKIAFESGASMITGGSVAIKDPELLQSWLVQYGPAKIILGSDFREGKIAVSGWQVESDRDLFGFLREWTGNGISQTICTDISKDGLLEGPSIETYSRILSEFPGLHLVASGGVSNRDDVDRLVDAGIPSVIIGKAIYEGNITLKELESYHI